MSDFFSDTYLNSLVWGLVIAALIIIPLEYIAEKWRQR